ncbi:Mpv17 / PMP22 family protein [Nitzschia inconspicua]|uniref:Mpv17 / PMP22 family protein n=1 Tax=Nitzschia inconspicua TaxID=303405 RepID=A0A9K3KEV3_9STRA|nr:Mpv17 / PMP22 family protein [Nitzschia inconspicua]
MMLYHSRQVSNLTAALARGWETLDDDNDQDVTDDETPVLPTHSSNQNNESVVDLEFGQVILMETGGDNEYNDDDNPFDDEEDNEESLRAFYDDFQSINRPAPMRHFSFSELSNESSPLLNPLKSMPKGTPAKFWFHRLWRWYNQCLNRRPVVTKSVTAGLIVSLGDFVGQCMQLVSSRSDEMEPSTPATFDVVRLAQFCSMGMFLQAPVTHYYYLALDHYLPPTPENPWAWVTFVKLFIDQTTYAPLFLFSVFLYLGFLEGDSWNTIRAQMQKEYTSTMVANWKLWIPATLLNMAYVPPQFRVLYCNVIFFVWSIFLSIVLNEEPPTNGR